MRFRECLESSAAQYFYCTHAVRVHRARPTSAAKVYVFNQLRLSVRSHCFTSCREYTRILHSRWKPTSKLSVLLQVRCTYYIYTLALFSAAAVMKLCIIKKRTTAVPGTGRWRRDRTMEMAKKHATSLCCVCTLRNPEFSAQISWFYPAASCAYSTGTPGSLILCCEMALTSCRVIWKLVTHTHTLGCSQRHEHFSYFWLLLFRVNDKGGGNMRNVILICPTIILLYGLSKEKLSALYKCSTWQKMTL
jgi:hypothetical protein